MLGLVRNDWLFVTKVEKFFYNAKPEKAITRVMVYQNKQYTIGLVHFSHFSHFHNLMYELYSKDTVCLYAASFSNCRSQKQ